MAGIVLEACLRRWGDRTFPLTALPDGSKLCRMF
jgi:hypothetical protein